MKRIIIVLLSLALLAACVPTPEKEFVVNKQDDLLEQRLSATPIPVPASAGKGAETAPQPTVKIEAEPETDVIAAPSGEPVREPITAPSEKPTAEMTPAEPTEKPAEQGYLQLFPEHWNDSIAVTDKLNITIDAQIVARADGVYPVYRTKERSFAKEEVLSILNALLPKPVKRLSGAETKEMVAAQIESFNEQAELWQEWRMKGSPESERPSGEELTDEEIAIVLDEYKEQLLLAPERDEEQPVSEFDPKLLRAVYELENGRTATVVVSDQTIAFSLGGGNIFTQAQYENALQFPNEAEFDVNSWKPVTLTRETAEETLSEALKRIGAEDFTVVTAQSANLMDGRTSAASGWVFTLARDYGGYPLEPAARADGRIKYAEDDAYEANASIPKEEIRILITEDGVADFLYGGPKKIVRVVNENVELMPFEELCERAKNGLRFGFSGYGPGANYEASFTVFKAVLTVYTLRIRNEDEYYEMPCWLLLFDHTLASGDYEYGRDLGKQYRALVINAVDGSIVNPKLGY